MSAIHKMKKYCKCGCGSKVRRENNRYISGHYWTGKRRSEETKRKMALRKKCIVCRRDIYRGGSSSRLAITKRRENAVTCSKECSRIYNRVSIHLRHSYRRQINKLKKELRRLNDTNTP